MATLHELFQGDATLSKLGARDRNLVSGLIYKQMSQQPDMPRETLREFREQQLEAVYQQERDEGRTKLSQDDWTRNLNRVQAQKKVNPNWVPGPMEEMPSDEAMQVFSTQRESNRSEWFKDLGEAAKREPAHLPLAVAKTGLDLANLVGAAGSAAFRTAMNTLSKNVGMGYDKGQSFFGDLAKGMQNNGWLSDWVTGKYEEQIRSDPALFKTFDTLAIDGLFGAISGAAAARGAAGLAAKAGVQPTRWELAKEAMAPVVSNVGAGQVANAAAPTIEKAIEGMEWDKDSKAGAILASNVLLGAVGGVGLGRVAEPWVKGTGLQEKIGRGFLKQAEEARQARIEGGQVEVPGSGELLTGNEALLRGMIAAPEFEHLRPQLEEQLAKLKSYPSEPSNFGLSEPRGSLDDAIAGKNKILAGEKPLPAEREALSRFLAPKEGGQSLQATDMLGMAEGEMARVEGRLNLENQLGEAIADRQKFGPASSLYDPTIQRANEARIKKLERMLGRPDESLPPKLTGPQAIRDGVQTVAEMQLGGAPIEQVQQVRESVAVMADPQGMLRSMRQELSTIDKELGELRGRWKSAEPEDRAAIEVEGRTLNERKSLIEGKLGQVEEMVARPVEAETQRVAESLGPQTAGEELKFAQAVEEVAQGREGLLGRELTGEEMNRVREQVLAEPSSWNGRQFDYAETLMHKKGELVNAGYVESKYPLVSELMQKTGAAIDRYSQTLQVNEILGKLQGMTDAIRPGITPEQYQVMRPYVEQANQLWDEIREGIEKPAGGYRGWKPLNSFMREGAKQFGLTQKQAARVANAITEAFPSLGLAFKFDRAMERDVTGLADALTRTVTLGENIQGIKDLAHELGHMHYYYGLDSAQRMDWLDTAFGHTQRAGAWEENFPGIRERRERIEQGLAAGQLTEEQVLAQERWMGSPAEMYASQFQAFLTDNVVPRLETLSTFGRLHDGLKVWFGKGIQDFASLPSDTQRFFLKLRAMPHPEEASRLSPDTAGRALERSTLWRGAEEAQGVVQAIQQGLEVKYPGISLLAPEERVAQLGLEDMGEALQASSLNLLHDLPGADARELQLLVAKAQEIGAPGFGEAQVMQRAQEMGQPLTPDVTGQGLAQVRRALKEGAEVVSADTPRQQMLLQVAKSLEDNQRGLEFAGLVQAKKGLIDLMDDSFAERIYQAEQYMNLPDLVKDVRGNRGWGAVGLELLLRGAYSAWMGLESDPENGYIKIPGLGNLRFTGRKFAEAPLALLALPGSRHFLRGALALGKKGGGTLLDSLGPETRDMLSRYGRKVNNAFQYAFGENMGSTKDLATMHSQARAKAATVARGLEVYADLLQSSYTPEQLRLMSKLYDAEEPVSSIKKAAGKMFRDVEFGAGIARMVMESINKDMRDLGVTQRDYPLPRYFNDTTKRKLKAVMLEANIPGIKLDFWRGQTVKMTVRDSKSLREFRDAAISEGFELTPGQRISMYVMPDGKTKKFCIPGSQNEQQLIQNGATPYSVWSPDGRQQGYEVYDVDRSGSIRIERPYRPEERAIRQEITELSVRMAAMAEKIRGDYTKAFLYNSIMRSDHCINPKDVKPGDLAGANQLKMAQESDNWHYIDDTEVKEMGIMKYGALGGTYVDDSALRLLKVFEQRGVLSRWMSKSQEWATVVGLYRKGLSAWKAEKTVLNPVGHINNFVGNLAMGYLTGHNPIAELNVGRKIYRVFKAEKEAQRLLREGNRAEADRVRVKMASDPFYSVYREITDNGMTESSMFATELKSDRFVDEVLASQTPGAPKSKWGQAFDTTKTALKKGYQWSADKYEQGDLIFKMGAYKLARDKGMSPQQALEYAYEAYFDYGQLSAGAKFLRDTGLVPFISYVYKAAPAIARGAWNNPGRWAGGLMALEAAQIVAAGAWGDDNYAGTAEAFEKIRPDFLRGKSLGMMKDRPTVWSNPSEGTQTVLDLSKFNPAGSMLEQGADRSDGTLVGLLKTLATSNPILQMVFMAATDKDPAMGRELGKMSIDGSKWGDFKKQMINTVLPNWGIVPGTYQFDKNIQGLVSAGILPEGFGEGQWGQVMGVVPATGKNFQGDKVSPFVQFASNFGIKLRDIKVADTAVKLDKVITSQENERKGILNTFLKGQNYSQGQKKRAIEEFMALRTKNLEKRKENMEALKTLFTSRRVESGGTTLAR